MESARTRRDESPMDKKHPTSANLALKERTNPILPLDRIELDTDSWNDFKFLNMFTDFFQF